MNWGQMNKILTSGSVLQASAGGKFWILKIMTIELLKVYEICQYFLSKFCAIW